MLRDTGMESFARYYGTYAGIVEDNADPDGLGRLKVKVPDIYGDDVIESWALPKFFTGKGQVGYFVPEKNDPIWVTFQKGGDARFPIWEGGWIIQGNKLTGSPDLKVIQTKSGNLVEFDDANGLIRITSASGSVFEIKDGISLGSGGESAEAAALGETLVDILEQLFDAIVLMTFVNSGGTTGVTLNKVAFDVLKLKLKTILSEIVTLD